MLLMVGGAVDCVVLPQLAARTRSRSSRVQCVLLANVLGRGVTYRPCEKLTNRDFRNAWRHASR